MLLAMLVLLPMGWLLAYAVTDETGALSWTNIAALSDRLSVFRAVHRDVRHCARRRVARVPAGRAAGVADRTDRRAGTAHAARTGDGFVHYASVYRRGRLGVAGRAEQRVVEPVLPLDYRRRTVRPLVQHLLGRGHHLCDGILCLSLRVRADGQHIGPDAARSGGSQRHPGRRTLAYIPPRHPADGSAGVAGRIPDRVPASHDSVRHTRNPGTACRIPCADHKDLEPVPVSAEGPSRRRLRHAAAAGHRPAVARRESSSWPARLHDGWRQVRHAATDAARALALARAAVRAVPAVRYRFTAEPRADPGKHVADGVRPLDAGDDHMVERAAGLRPEPHGRRPYGTRWSPA